MKKLIIFIFTMSFLLFIGLTDNVFAESLVPPYAYIDNQAFITAGSVLDKHVNRVIHNAVGVTYIDVPVSLTWEEQTDYQQYPYLLIYFKSNASNISIVRNSSCTTSCFSSAISLVKLGYSNMVDFNYSPTYMYAMIVPYNKMSFYDNWAVYRVDDVFRFTTTDNFVAVFEFDNIFATKDLSLLNSAFDINQQNKNDTQNIINNQNQNQQQTNEKLDDLNDTMQDDTAPTNNDFTSQLGNISVAPNTPVSNLVLLPINFLNRLIDLSDNQCVSYNLGNFYGTDLTLPCLTLSNYFGTDLWQTIDYLVCFFMIYNFAMLCIMAWEDFTSLRDDYNSLYQPKHAKGEYQPKHGGD